MFLMVRERTRFSPEGEDLTSNQVNIFQPWKVSMLKGFIRHSHIYRRGIYGLLSLVIALGISLGQPLPSQAIPWGEILFRGIQLIQLSNLSDRQEVDLGRQINAQLAREIKLSQNLELTTYINQIGQRIAQASSRPNIPYTFQVVNDGQINAFATMGGFVYVNKGLIKAADNEAQLASVISHEIGHIAGRHAIKQMKDMTLAQGIASVAGLNKNQVVQLGVELALRRPKSREAEYEADRLGLENLIAAGYAPSGMVDFMQKLLTQSSVPTFLSTHPATSDRIAALQQAIPPDQAMMGGGLDNLAYQQSVQQLLR